MLYVYSKGGPQGDSPNILEGGREGEITLSHKHIITYLLTQLMMKQQWSQLCMYSSRTKGPGFGRILPPPNSEALRMNMGFSASCWHPACAHGIPAFSLSFLPACSVSFNHLHHVQREHYRDC